MECSETVEDSDLDLLEEISAIAMDDWCWRDPFPASKYWLASMVPPSQASVGVVPVVRPNEVHVYCRSRKRMEGVSSAVVCSSLSSDSLRELSVLPPCKVCGEMASGFHYGANTCEACKGFFRRSLRRTSTSRCSNQGNCEISASTRGQCSSCRYNKCLSVGMSKEAIKTGRYTHEKKSKDLEEVRKMMQTRLLPGVPHSKEYLFQIIHAIVRTHLYYSKACVPDIPEREEEHLKIHDIEKKVFGSLKTIPLEEYLKIYHVTGIDVDGRKEMLEGFVPLVEHNIRKLMAVAKSVPGFDELPVEDQIQIIKSSRFEVWMILHHKQFNPARKLFTTIHGKVVCYEDMVKLHSEEYIESLMSAQRRIRSLDLDYEETCTLAAFTVMFSGVHPHRCSLTSPSLVESMHELLLRCLNFLLDCNSPECPNSQGRSSQRRFWRVINVLLQLRSVKHLHDFEEEKLIRLWFDKLSISPLIYEMWAL